ncbi:hypothetical protein chiPu_0024485, partial [Chiloscyllium punctatum]|nr:hypothetical protein [Chiloscyllium punctatum]
MWSGSRARKSASTSRGNPISFPGCVRFWALSLSPLSEKLAREGWRSRSTVRREIRKESTSTQRRNWQSRTSYRAGLGPVFSLPLQVGEDVSLGKQEGAPVGAVLG